LSEPVSTITLPATPASTRAVPSDIRSVYFDVSSRLIAGWFITLSRRSHFTLVLPSQPGSSSRIG
jgi:hypothetical protein